jgi:hypothetical protein
MIGKTEHNYTYLGEKASLDRIVILEENLAQPLSCVTLQIDRKICARRVQKTQ